MGTHARNRPHARHLPASSADPFFDEHGWTRVPRLVQWLVTARCPLACPHCLAATDEGGGGEMSLPQAARLIEQVAAMGVDEFLLTGGEPLARPDLSDIIAILRANGVRWSLNTAALPDRAARRAMEHWPPGFVAVSLDGPKPVHDRFRGREGAFDDALDSVAWFATLAPGAVAGGTTVTSHNFAHLAETFWLVVESGAAEWGLHLPVPEGRAAQRPDLFLSRRQLRLLLRFAADKRALFPVVMADEIGYCGAWEPLVRDAPFFCGAGRAQCVVLPGGQVVPCTTLDRSTAAGNVLHTPLQHIWEHGFAELRQWTPPERCAQCDYAPACQGGCWLQRRHGTECFRDAWHVPGALAKAGLMACLGLGAAAVRAEPAPEPVRPSAPAVARPDTRQMQILQSCIVQWYASQVGGRRAPRAEAVLVEVRSKLPDDPGARYLVRFATEPRPDDVAARAKEIDDALGTRQVSLCLVGLAWRDVAEWCFDGPDPVKRTPAQRAALRRVLARLGSAAETWRAEVFRQKLDPFLRQPGDYRRFLRSKAGPPPWVRMQADLAVKRGLSGKEATEGLLGQRPHAQVMALPLDASGAPGLRCVRRGREQPADGELRVFDLLVVPADCDEPPMLAFTLDRATISVAVPPGAELTYADVLRLVAERHRAAVERLVQQPMRWSRRPAGAPFAIPVLCERLVALGKEPRTSRTASQRYSALWQLIDLYLF